jgi:hypothetical protein
MGTAHQKLQELATQAERTFNKMQATPRAANSKALQTRLEKLAQLVAEVAGHMGTDNLATNISAQVREWARSCSQVAQSPQSQSGSQA